MKYKTSRDNPQPPTPTEFFGPVGAVALIVGLPLFVVFSHLSAAAFNFSVLNPSLFDWLVVKPILLQRFVPSYAAVGKYLFWLTLQGVLYVLLPGRRATSVWPLEDLIDNGESDAERRKQQGARGEPKDSRRRLVYVMNGLPSFVLSLGLCLGLHFTGIIDLGSAVVDDLPAIMVTAQIVAFLIAVGLYAKATLQNRTYYKTGNVLYDFFMGIELNPRIGRHFDLKFFFEGRPGLTGLVLICLSFLIKHYQIHGSVSIALILVCLFITIYIADYMHSEEAILSTMDITTDRFGWMLCWGDIVFVPFMYSLSAYYLVYNDSHLSVVAAAAILALDIGAIALFRISNGQKHLFRTHPEQYKNATYIKTARGTALLTSGCWGWSRHPNYLADILQGLAWCLPTGLSGLLPYFYFLNITVLLMHRERRDNHNCQRKYGKDWDKYCAKVPYRIVPYLY